jgi:ribosomal protein L9
MAKKEFRATKNLTLGEDAGVEVPKGAKHASVKKGEVVEVHEDYAEKHLVPHGHVEDVDAAHEREEAELAVEAEKLEQKHAAVKEKAEKAKSKKKGKKAD